MRSGLVLNIGLAVAILAVLGLAVTAVVFTYEVT